MTSSPTSSISSNLEPSIAISAPDFLRPVILTGMSVQVDFTPLDRALDIAAQEALCN